MTLPTSPKGYGGTSPAKRGTKLPRPGDIVRDGLTGEEVVIKAEDQTALRQFNELIWKEYGEARKIGYFLGAYFNEMSERRLYLAAGFQYEKEFYEKKYSEIGRSTIMRLRKIARAFDLRVSLRETRKNLALPEFCSLEQKKLEMLARLPEEMRNDLKKKGKITISKGTSSRIVSLDELRTMPREEVQMLVGIALDDPIGGSRRGEGIREYVCDMSPEAAKILELIFRRRDMMIGLVSKFERLGEEQWTKVQRKRVADELRGVCDVLLRKARAIDPTKGRAAYPSSRGATTRQGGKTKKEKK